jgi:TrmH family RNA methyltransferase
MAGTRIVLVRTKDSANVGGTARAMRNFGLDDLWLVAPRCRIDERARALASHAGDILDSAKVVESLDEAVAGLRLVVGTSARSRRAPSYRVATPREAAPLLTDGTAVLFGPEDHGLANEELTRCQLHVAIPTAEFSSLNLAQAVLVIAYEAWLVGIAGAERPPDAAAVGRGGRTGEAPASRDQLERFYSQLEGTLLRIGYTDAPRAPSVMRMFRAVFDRADLSAHELSALRGLASQVRWAADQQPERLPPSKKAEETSS